MKHRKMSFVLVACVFLAGSAVASSFNLEREVARVMMDPRVPDTSQPKWQRSSYQDIIDAARAARLDSRQTSIDVPGNITGKNPMSIRYISGYFGFGEEPVTDTWGDDEDIVYVTGATDFEDQALTVLPGTIVLFSAFNDDENGGQLAPDLIQDLRDAYAIDPGAYGLLQTMLGEAPYIGHFASLNSYGVLVALGQEDSPIIVASDASATDVTPYDYDSFGFTNGVLDYIAVFDCYHADTHSSNTLTSRSRFDNNLASCRNGSGHVLACHFGNTWNECIALYCDDIALNAQYNLFDNSWNVSISLSHSPDSAVIKHNTVNVGPIVFLEDYVGPPIFELEANDIISSELQLQTAEDIAAQNNYWGTTNVSEIESAIWDENDDPLLGTVTFQPFLTSPDTDRDGLRDDEEGVLGTDPDVMDSDNDGLIDGLEVEHGANPLVADTDGDGQNDGTEVWLNGTDPTDPESRLPVSSAIGFAALAGLLVTLTSYRIIRSRLTCRNVKNR